MVKVSWPCYSLSAHGWLGKVSYHRRGFVTNAYPVGALNPYLVSAPYYSPVGWCYQRRRTWHGVIWSAIKPPVPSNPQTEEQQAWRAKFASGVALWQGMDEETKDYYNKLNYPEHASGYNRFLHYYLLDKPC